MVKWEWQSLWHSRLIWGLLLLAPVLAGLIFVKTQADQASQRDTLIARLNTVGDNLDNAVSQLGQAYRDTQDKAKKAAIDKRLARLSPLADIATHQKLAFTDGDNTTFLTNGQKVVTLSRAYVRDFDPTGQEVRFSAERYAQQIAWYHRIQQAGLGFELPAAVRAPNFFYNLASWFCAPAVVLVLALALHLTRLQDHWRGSNALLLRNLQHAGAWPLARLAVDLLTWLGLLITAALAAALILTLFGHPLLPETSGSWSYPLVVHDTIFMPLLTAVAKAVLIGTLTLTLATTLFTWAERFIRQAGSIIIGTAALAAAIVGQWLWQSQGILLLAGTTYLMVLAGLALSNIIVLSLTIRAYAH